MSDNRRASPRIPMAVSIKVRHPSLGERLLKTRNVSDTGVYLVVEPEGMPPVGTVLMGQVQGMEVEAPWLAMEIVRTDEDGLGLHFHLEDT